MNKIHPSVNNSYNLIGITDAIKITWIKGRSFVIQWTLDDPVTARECTWSGVALYLVLCCVTRKHNAGAVKHFDDSFVDTDIYHAQKLTV